MSNADSSLILVTGSGGILGSSVVSDLILRGFRVRGTGRKAVPEEFPGEWVVCDLKHQSSELTHALSGISAIIHCASTVQTPEDDLTVVQNLIAEIGVRPIRFVFVSIAGIDRAAEILEYYRIKIKCETALRESRIPQVSVRISQFHPFVEMILTQLSRGPFEFCPKMTLQPIDIPFAAQELVLAATEPLKEPLINVHGPEMLSASELIAAWSEVRGRHTINIPIPSFGLVKALALLEPVIGRTGGLTWREWLQSSNGLVNPYLKPS